MPGPRSDPRATFPKVPWVGRTKALGSKNRSGVPKITGPLKFGFQFGTSELLESPVPEVFEQASDVKGHPPASLTPVFHCEPLISLSTTLVAPLRKVCPFPNGN